MNLKTFEEMQHTSVFFIPGITAEARIITDRTTVLRMVLRKLDFINWFYKLSYLNQRSDNPENPA